MMMMKQMIMTLLAAVMVSTAAVAQNKDSNKPSVDNNRKQEMVKHRTDRMVEDYQLNNKQAKKLLELNTEYADKMRPRHYGHHGHHGPHGMRGQRPEPPKADMEGERPEPPKGDREEHRKEMAETMKAYDAELQKIMTKEQYEKYKADMQQRRERGHRGPQERG
jgi:Spy/CpxP family protein refolding chaperone